MKASKGGFGKLQNRVSVINVAPKLRKSGVNLFVCNLYTPPCHFNSLPKGLSQCTSGVVGKHLIHNILYDKKINSSQSDLESKKWSFSSIFLSKLNVYGMKDVYQVNTLTFILVLLFELVMPSFSCIANLNFKDLPIATIKSMNKSLMPDYIKLAFKLLFIT